MLLPAPSVLAPVSRAGNGPGAALPPVYCSIGQSLKAHAAGGRRGGGEDEGNGLQTRRMRRLRDRPELVVGHVIGGGVEIYDVEATRLLSSYAVPPDESCSCAPVSVVVVNEGEGGRDVGEESGRPARKKRRLTFAATAPATASSAAIMGPTNTMAGTVRSAMRKERIMCWEERLGNAVAIGDRIRMRARAVTNEEGKNRRIVHLGIHSGGGLKVDGEEQAETGPNLVAIFDNGDVNGWTETLEDAPWLHGKIDLPSADWEVEKVAIVSLDKAKRGILKGRDDVAAVVEAKRGTELLITVVREYGDRKASKRKTSIQICYFPSRRESEMTALHGENGLELLATISVPEPEEMAGLKCEFWFDNFIGRIYQMAEESKYFATYDLTGVTARLQNQIKLEKKVKSVLPLSSGAVATINAATISVIDTKYSSVLASGPLVSVVENGDRREGARSAVSAGPARLLTYFSGLGLVVALHGRYLVTLQANSNSSDASSRKRMSHGTLADAVAHGTEIRRNKKHASIDARTVAKIGDMLCEQPLGKSWTEATAGLDEMLRSGNTEGVDKLICELLSLGVEDWEWEEFHPNDPHYKRLHIQFVLSKFFSLEKTSPTSSFGQYGLKANIFPTGTMSWLAVNGFLTQHEIEMALKRYSSMPVVETLCPYAMIEALYRFDQSLQTLIFLLASPIVLSAVEIACAIKFALHTLQQAHDLANKKLISGASQTADEMELDAEPGAITSEREPLDTMVRVASPSPEPGADVAHDAHALIQHCLSRLYNTPQAALQSALAIALPSPTDLLALTDYLRLALARDGWFSRYLDASAPQPNVDLDGFPEDSVLAPAPIGATASLLNAAIDTLGTGAWLQPQPQLEGLVRAGKTASTRSKTTSGGAPADVAAAASTLGHMRAEISAALEGVEEAAYLAGMLGEVLLFSKTAPKNIPTIATAISSTPTDASIEPVAAATATATSAPSHSKSFFSKPITVVGSTPDHRYYGMMNALPLGLKASSLTENRLDARDMYRMSGGGEFQKRSKRDVGRLKSMRVGRHTFERIVI